MPFSMRHRGLVLLCTLGLASLAATVSWARSTPQIRAQQAHEKAVIAQVNRIGQDLQSVQDQAWNAKQRLNLVKRSLRQNEYRLQIAKGNFHAAQQRIMQRLYSLYVNGSPSAVDVLAGAQSLSQIIDR